MIATKDRERGIGAWQVTKVESWQGKPGHLVFYGLNHFETWKYGEPDEFRWLVYAGWFKNVLSSKVTFDFTDAEFEDGAMDIFIAICGDKAKADEILNHKHTPKDGTW